MKLGVINLGCPKNTVDTECMLSYLYDFQLTTNPKEADYILINTCAFLKDSRRESSEAITEMLRNKKSKVIVAGCFVSKDLPGLKKKFKGVHAWVGVNDLGKIRQAIERGGEFVNSAPCVYKAGEHTALINPYSAYVKISDGCNHRCSFCVIPSIKGKYRSRLVDDIALEVKNMVDSGVKEINLISQDLTYYGRDNYGRPMLDGLLKAILKKTKKYFWLRLLYLYPDIEIIKKIAGLMKKDARLCKYMDIPFQHVSDRILKSMRRGYGKKDILKLIREARKACPGLTLRTSFITGYPGETAKESSELLDFVKDGAVEKAGVFAYSDEPGTYAYSLKGKVPLKEAGARKERLALASAEVCYYNNKNETGNIKRSLIAGKKGRGLFIGRTAENAPDIDSYIYIRSSKPLKTGNFYDVKVTGYDGFDLKGEVISGKERD